MPPIVHSSLKYFLLQGTVKISGVAGNLNDQDGPCGPYKSCLLLLFMNS